jgi:hypothetical protein
MPKRKDGNINVSATNLHASAIGIGHGAQAIYNQTNQELPIDEIVTCVQAAITALKPLPMKADAHAAAEDGLRKTIEASRQQNLPAARSALERVGLVLKEAGVTLQNAVDLAAPLGKLMALLGMARNILP